MVQNRVTSLDQLGPYIRCSQVAPLYHIIVCFSGRSKGRFNFITYSRPIMFFFVI